MRGQTHEGRAWRYASGLQLPITSDVRAIAECAMDNGLAALRETYGDERFPKVNTSRFSDDFSVYDTYSGWRVKVFHDAVEAGLQFGVMNALHDALLRRDVGVRAVGYGGLLAGEEASVALIEESPGIDVRRRYQTMREWRERVSELKRRLDQAIGSTTRHLLVNDITRMNNYAGNLLEDDAGTLYLIDQPLRTRWPERVAARVAARALISRI